jgi:hypothetical protein
MEEVQDAAVVVVVTQVGPDDAVDAALQQDVVVAGNHANLPTKRRGHAAREICCYTWLNWWLQLLQ